MIEALTAQSGEPVLKVDGRLMASRIDPRAEAREWVDRRSSLLSDVRSVIVLGLGAGYHVLELCARTSARVVVIEPREDLIAAVPVTFDPTRVNIVHGETVAAIASIDSVRQALGHSYLVLSHPASRTLRPNLHRDLIARFDGRSPASLDFVWSLRGHAPLGDVPQLDARPITIYDLAQYELISNSNERERALISALRELVK